MEKKYELTEETIEENDHILHRIKAVKDFSNVKVGDLGGFVEKEDNLSHEGNCWIYDDAKVYGNAKISDNSCIYDSVRVFNNAQIYGNAIICDKVIIFGSTKIYENAVIRGWGSITGHAKIHGEVIIFRDFSIYEYAEIFGMVRIRNSTIGGNSQVYGKAWIYNSYIGDYAKIFGDVILEQASIYGNTKIEKNSDYIVFKNWWSSGRFFTWTRSNNRWKVGCFYGTGEELIKKAYRDSELSGREYERIVRYVESILQDAEINQLFAE